MGLAQKLRKKVPAPCKWAADPSDAKTFKLWREDAFAQDSRYYSAANRVVAKKTGVVRRLTIAEEETLMGFGADYTYVILEENKDAPVQETAARRQRLLGKATNVGALVWWLSILVVPLMKTEAQSQAGLVLTMNGVVQERKTLGWGTWVSKAEHGGLKCAIEAARNELPYTLYKASQGVAANDVDGADYVDLNAHATLALAAGMQGRQQACSAKGRKRLVERGLEPHVHVDIALNLTSPCSSPFPSRTTWSSRLRHVQSKGWTSGRGDKSSGGNWCPSSPRRWR
jgi:hypothetical protein